MINQNTENLPIPQEVAIRDADNHPLMVLRTADMALLSTGRQTQELDAHSISQLNHLLSLVPSSVTAVAGNAKQLMACSFDYSKLIQAKDCSGAIGAVYKEGTNRIGAQARFHEVKTLKSAVNTGLLLNIASQAVAQKHLADINERLKSIEGQVKGVQEFLEQSRFAKMQVLQEHLQRLATMLKNQEEILPDTMQVLAHSVQSVRAEVVHIRRDLEKVQQQVKDFDCSRWFGSDDVRVALQEKIKRLSHLQSEYLLGMKSLLVANLVLYIKYGGNKEFVHASDDYLAELHHENGLLAQWNATMCSVRVHLSKMKPVFELTKSTQANVLLVENTVAKVQQMITQDAQQIRQLQQKIVDAQAPRIILEVENGSVACGYYLS
jgi:hypothetical protein